MQKKVFITIINKLLFFVEEVIPVVSLMVMFAITILQVFMRYVMNAALPWPEELALLLLVNVIYLGSVLATEENKLLSIDAVRELCGHSIGIMAIWASCIFTVLFCLIVGVWGIFTVIDVMESGMDTTTLHVPMWIFYPVIPVGMFLMAFRAILLARKELAKAKNECASKYEVKV